MTSNLNIRTDWSRVGAGLSVRFSLESNRVNAEWLPRLPTKREFRRVEDRYRKARFQFIEEIARQIGGTVACVEVPHEC